MNRSVLCGAFKLFDSGRSVWVSALRKGTFHCLLSLLDLTIVHIISTRTARTRFAERQEEMWLSSLLIASAINFVAKSSN
jgi:hypothetical protein